LIVKKKQTYHQSMQEQVHLIEDHAGKNNDAEIASYNVKIKGDV
jgi:hypothetical protein